MNLARMASLNSNVCQSKHLTTTEIISHNKTFHIVLEDFEYSRKFLTTYFLASDKFLLIGRM